MEHDGHAGGYITHRIAGWSFCQTRALRILRRLRAIDSSYLIYGSNTSHYEAFVSQHPLSRPTYLVGLGDYSGRDQDRIRIESYCTNKFRNSYVDATSHCITDGASMRQTHALVVPSSYDTTVCKRGEGMGNGHCNHACWKLCQCIAQLGCEIRVVFFHIPRRVDTTRAVSTIDEVINSLI